MLNSLKKLSENEAGVIVETDLFKAGLQYLEDIKRHHPLASTMALVDLDNTAITYAHTLVTDHWIDEEFKHLRAQGKSFDEIKDLIIPLYIRMVAKVHPEDTKLVEEDTPSVIKSLQASGTNTLVLTSRGSLILAETLKQLEKFNIDFNQGEYANREKVLSTLGPEGLFRNGIIMTGGQDKGKGLVLALDDKLPDFIIMWDDKLSNLEKVRAAIKDYNQRKLEENPHFTAVKFVGVRYSRLDAVVNNVNRHITQCQLQYVDRILSDEHAGYILRGEAKKTRQAYVDVQLNQQATKLIIAVHKHVAFQKLSALAPEIYATERSGKVSIIDGKPKLARVFELSTEFYFSLRESGLIHANQIAVLDPLLDKTVSLTPSFSALSLGSARTTSDQEQQSATVTASRVLVNK